MTPEKLRAAAARIAALSEGWGDYDYHDNNKLSMCAQHILDTVRDDDDLPVDWTKCGLQKNLDKRGGVRLYKVGEQVAYLYAYEIKTRGQLRAICRALGVTLQESAQ